MPVSDGKAEKIFKKLMESIDSALIYRLCCSTNKDNAKGHSNVCGDYHGLPAFALDFVDHATVTKIFIGH